MKVTPLHKSDLIYSWYHTKSIIEFYFRTNKDEINLLITYKSNKRFTETSIFIHLVTKFIKCLMCAKHCFWHWNKALLSWNIHVSGGRQYI